MSSATVQLASKFQTFLSPLARGRSISGSLAAHVSYADCKQFEVSRKLHSGVYRQSEARGGATLLSPNRLLHVTSRDLQKPGSECDLTACSGI